MAEQALEFNIERIRRRIRVLHALRWSVLFALGGALASLLALAVTKLVRRPFPAVEDGLFLLVCALAGALVGYFRRVTPLQAAVATDARLGLHERLSSALHFLREPEPDPMVQALVADATERADAVDIRAVYPVRMPREGRALGGALLILCLALFLPMLPAFQSTQARAEKEAMKKEGERIVRIARDMRRAPDPNNTELTRRISQNLEQLGKQMRAGRLTKKQALVQLNKLTKDVAEAQKEMAKQLQGTKSLAQAAAELRKAAKDAAADPKAGESAKRLKEMADALESGNMAKAEKLLKEMAQQAASGKMSAQELQRMAQEAAKMAQSMSGSQLQKAAQQLQQGSQQLQQAAKQAQSGNQQGAQQQMAQAAQKMQQAGGT